MIVRNSIIYSTAAVVTKLGSFLLLPVWTAYLSPAEYGVIGTMSAYIAMCTPLLLLGIPNAAIRQYVDYIDDEKNWGAYVGSNLIVLMLVSLPIYMLVVLFGEGAWSKMTSGDISFYPYVPLAGYIVILSMLLRYVQATMQARQKAHQEVMVTFTLFVLTSIIGLTAVIRFSVGPIGYFIGFAISATMVTILLVLFIGKTWITSSLSIDYAKKALKYGLPLVPLAISAWVMHFSDRILVESVTGLAQAGIYNVSSNGALIMLFIVMSTNKAWTPQYFLLMKNEVPGTKMATVVSACVVLYSIMAIGLIVVGVPVLVKMLPLAYSGLVQLLPPIVLGYVMFGLYHLSVKPLLYLNQTGKMSLMMVVGAGMNICLNLYYIPKYGAVAAAWTTLASYSSMLVMAMIVTRGKHKVNYPFLKYVVMLLLVFLSLSFVNERLFEDLWSMIRVTGYVAGSAAIVGLLFWKTIYYQLYNEKI